MFHSKSPRHILCARFIQWPIDRIRRAAERSGGVRWLGSGVGEKGDSSTLLPRYLLPLVLIHDVASRQLVSAACERARVAGVRVGMTLAEARAICPGLTHAPDDPEKDHRALEALGRWMTRFSPVVAVESPNCLLIDLTGCERLFGGIEPIARRVTDSLRRMRIEAKVAVAPTIGAAWALTCGAVSDTSGKPVSREMPPTAPSFSLQPSTFSFFPVASLRLPPSTVATLHHLGVETIGQLLALDRPALLTRFGPDVLLRIDQLLGRAPEMLRPLEYRTPIRAKMEFDGSVTAIEAIWEVLRRLVDELTQQLARVGGGARRVEAEFRRAYSPPVRKTILLSRASREPKNLFGLLRCATENLDVRDGIDAHHAADGFYCDGFVSIVLTAPAWERIGDEQRSIDGETEQASMGEVSRLVETLSVRLGPQSVIKARLHACHLPERAYKTAEGVRADLTPIEITPLKKKSRRRGKAPTYGRLPKERVVERRQIEDSRSAYSLSPLAGEGEKGFLDSDTARQLKDLKPLPQPSPASGERGQEATLADDASRQTHKHEPPTSPSGSAPFLRLADPYVNWQPLVPDLPEGADDPDRTDVRQIAAPDESSTHLPLAARPVHLLPMPRELRVMSASGEPGEEQLPLTFADGRQTYRVTHATGPERIAGLWWEGRDKTRDYYDIETAEGKRFWVFRVPQTGRWFLHGEWE